MSKSTNTAIGIFFFSSVMMMLSVLSTSCKKKITLSNENLSFSTDTLVFDTVFTSIGSTTKNIKFYNPANAPVQVEEIELMGGTNSAYRINVDGISGDFIRDISLAGKDSLFVFVEVTLDPNNNTQPLVIEDSIRFRTNGKDQYVVLAAWGQDAYFHYNDINEGIWPNDKPHVIYGFAAVDSAKSLTIPAGTTIHLHKNSILYNYKGTLNVEGEKDNKVIFQGDRLEPSYDDITGQYYGIYMQEARPSVIRHAEIKNGIAGIHVFSRDPDFTEPTLKIQNCEIYNNSNYGVFLYSGAIIEAENTIIYGNGLHALLVLEGGTFDFNHCHLLSYGSSGQSPAVGISNYFDDQFNQQTNVGQIPLGRITNSIVGGFQDNEIAIDTLQVDGQITLNFEFDHNLMRLKEIPEDDFYKDIIWNDDPLFTNIVENDFSFSPDSPLENAGSANFAVPTDFFENTRNMSAPDIGAIEQ